MLLDKLRKNYNIRQENSSTFYNTIPSKVNKIEKSYWKEENFSYDYDPNKSDFIYTSNYNNVIHAIIGKKDGSSPSKYVVISSDGSTFIEKAAPPIDGYSYLIPYNNKLYMFCAYTTTFYVLSNNSWVAFGLVPYDFYGGAVYVYNNQIHVLGGNNNLQLHYAYSDSSKTWTAISDLSDYDDGGGKYYLDNFSTQKVAVFNNSIWYFLRSNKENDNFSRFVNYTAENKFKPKPYNEGATYTGTGIKYNLLIVSNNILYWFSSKNAGGLLPYYTDDIGKTNSVCITSIGDVRTKSIHLEDALDCNNKMHGFSFNSDINKIKRYTFNSGAVDPSVKYNFEAALVEHNEINSLDFILPIDSVIYTNADVTGNVLQTGNSYTVKADNQTIKIINGYEDNVYISIYSNDDFLFYSKPAITIPESQTKQYYFIPGTIVNDVPIITEGLTEIELPAVITYKNISEHDHVFFESGSNHVCSICGLSEDHAFSEDFTVDTEPTCSNSGSKSNHCIKCTAKTNVSEIPVIPHNYNSTIMKEAACEEEGLTTFTCSSCGHSYEETIPALGHDYSTEFTVDVPPTCKSVGSKSKHCSRCAAITEVTEIPMAEHNYVSAITKQATCTEEGLMTFTCSMCNDTYEEVIPALGHDYVNGTCTNCGDTKVIAPNSETANWKYTLDEENKKIILNQYIGNANEVIVYEAYNVNGNIYNTALVSNSDYKIKTLFSGNQNITSIRFNSGIDMNNINSMESMFYGCSSLTHIDFSYFNTSNVTNMGYVFSSCSSLQILNLTSFDTRNVTNMSAMFSNCSSLVTLDVNTFDTSKVGNMGSMFHGCSSLVNLNLSNFKVDNIGSTYYNGSFNSMFYSCTNLVSLNLSGFGSTKVACDCGYMFKNCNKLSTLTMSNFAPIVKTFNQTFYGCSSLKSLDLSKWNVNNETNMNELFSSCSALENLNVSTWDTSNVVSMVKMFAGLKIKTLDLRSFNTKNVTSLKGMFMDCINLSNIYVAGSKWITSQSDTTNMFLRCACSSVTYS